MGGYRMKMHRAGYLRAKVSVLACLATLATPVQADLWQPALHCAALDLTRAALLAGIDAPRPTAGTAAEARQSGEAYLRIATEAMGCPPADEVNTLLRLARTDTEIRVEMAQDFGHGPDVLAMVLASEAELTCALHFDPDLLSRARSATAPVCSDD